MLKRLGSAASGSDVTSQNGKKTFLGKEPGCLWHSWQPLHPDLDSTGSSGSFSDPSNSSACVWGGGEVRGKGGGVGLWSRDSKIL